MQNRILLYRLFVIKELRFAVCCFFIVIILGICIYTEINSSKYIPRLRAEKMELIRRQTENIIRGTPLSTNCKMVSCFNFSRCSILSGFPVYFYDPKDYKIAGNVDPVVKKSVVSAFDSNAFVVKNPEIACIFVVLVGKSDSTNLKILEKTLRNLPFWHGDGQNHILVNVARDTYKGDIFGNLNTGKAIIVQSSFHRTSFREKFDVIIPPSYRKETRGIWEDLTQLSPIRRKYLLSFSGEFCGELKTRSQEESQITPIYQKLKYSNADEQNRGMNKKEKHRYVDMLIISVLKKWQTTMRSKEIYIALSCDSRDGGGINGEWSLCADQNIRKEVLTRSTFSLLISPSNANCVSTSTFQIRLYEALKYGTVPVILGDNVKLPFDEIIDWKKAAIILSKSQASELILFLKSYTNDELEVMKKYGRYYFETYFGTVKNIIDALLDLIRIRLNISPFKIQEEPSHKAHSLERTPTKPFGQAAYFQNNTTRGFKIEIFPPLVLKSGVSQDVIRELFKKSRDPFSTPFDKALSLESKLNGSLDKFQLVSKEQGDLAMVNKTSENIQREQFTIVMLTYSRLKILFNSLKRLKGLPDLNKVIVVWNNWVPPSQNITWPNINAPVHVIKSRKNSLNNRFLPYDAIETEAILSLDDDTELTHDDIVFGFRVWREERNRLVGFPGRSHAWDDKSSSWVYVVRPSSEISLVLTGAAFFHKYFAYLYSYVMPQAIRDRVDVYMNCEDIAMNFLVSHFVRKPPIVVTTTSRFSCEKCRKALSRQISHYTERSKCINFFVKVYGYMPLRYTKYRVDKVLGTKLSSNLEK